MLTFNALATGVSPLTLGIGAVGDAAGRRLLQLDRIVPLPLEQRKPYLSFLL